MKNEGNKYENDLEKRTFQFSVNVIKFLTIFQSDVIQLIQDAKKKSLLKTTGFDTNIFLFLVDSVTNFQSQIASEFSFVWNL